ncbi:MAG: GxxExxY protein [Desulfobacteraceae bacterium]|nr:GxxExxY protein [Desulfobacteraceae bacterium]MBC2756770.1 GxxExxY protein [Desulfobacteraceae bacterium]
MSADKEINNLTYQINGAIFQVSRTLGAGFLEKVYEKALLIELRERGLKAESQAPIKISYKGQAVGEYFADILVCNKIIIELKCVENFSKLNEAQILNYLKATGLQVGLLVNFKYPKAEIKRMVLGLKE